MARPNGTATDPTRKRPLPEIREEFEYYTNEWREIRAAAAEDMRYVAGQPFSDDDLDARGDRPTVAPDEMTQYRVQVTNALRKAPRGVKFQPAGRGAGEKIGEFYQNKWREIEYRSHAIEHYIGAAENVLQRGYGAFGSTSATRIRATSIRKSRSTASPIPTSCSRSDDQAPQRARHERLLRARDDAPDGVPARWPGAEVRNFSDYMRPLQGVDPSRARRAARAGRGAVEGRDEAQLHAVVVGGRRPRRRSKPIALFEDEIEAFLKSRPMQGLRCSRTAKIRDVDYPKVVRRITNGLEVLETESWPGKYIPIVLMFGPILYVPDGGTVEKRSSR
jgi:hypothetical protein